MKFTASALIILALLLPLRASAAEKDGGQDALSSDTVWEEAVQVEKTLTVPKDVTLSIRPGTVVRFGKGAELVVQGTLEAEGLPDSRITFTCATTAGGEPGPGYWKGITFAASGEDTYLKDCVVENAGTVSLAGCSPEISGCEISGCLTGISLDKKASPKITGNRITGMKTGGINCRVGSNALIKDNIIKDCGDFGVSATQSSQPEIVSNEISGCGIGITSNRCDFPIKDNTLTGNKAGIVTTFCGAGMDMSGNTLKDNETGIVCRQFSNPVLEENLITGSDAGIICFMSSSPLIRHNEITGNKDGIGCKQICNPTITANDIHGNERAIYLHLSSFAVIHGNNIYDNKVELQLINMSSDWENRVRNKPERGAQAQNEELANRGRAVRQRIPENARFPGFVDATGNWWGKDVTAEMDKKGPDANIDGFIDYYDTPTRTYEGYEGEYEQDRIKYEGWLSGPAEGAGRQDQSRTEE